MSDQQDKFIILKKTKYGEADLIIHALSTNGAKKSFIARSALKSKKRFGGGILEPTHYVVFTYKQGKNEEALNILSEATLINDFKEIRGDFDKLEFALLMLKCAYMVSQEGELHSHFLFNLIGHSLKSLGAAKNLRCYKLHFYLKFLFQQGVISVEAWMAPFLKLNMSETNQLEQLSEINELIDDYLDSIESQVLHYIKNADAGF